MAPGMRTRLSGAGLYEVDAMRISLDDISLDRALVAAKKSPKTKAPYTFTIRNETWTSLEVVTQQDPPNLTPDVVAWFIPVACTRIEVYRACVVEKRMY